MAAALPDNMPHDALDHGREIPVYTAPSGSQYVHLVDLLLTETDKRHLLQQLKQLQQQLQADKQSGNT